MLRAPPTGIRVLFLAGSVHCATSLKRGLLLLALHLQQLHLGVRGVAHGVGALRGVDEFANLGLLLGKLRNELLVRLGDGEAMGGAMIRQSSPLLLGEFTPHSPPAHSYAHLHWPTRLT